MGRQLCPRCEKLRREEKEEICYVCANTIRILKETEQQFSSALKNLATK